MLTFNQIYAEVQAQTQDFDATSLVIIKRAINQGARKFYDILGREWRDDERTFDIIANQQFYQMPEDCIRIKEVTETVGSITYPLNEVAETSYWQELNMRAQHSNIPQFYYVKGSDQYGIWPIPSSTRLGGGTLTFERDMRDMTQDDVISPGTISLTNNNNAVVGSGTTFNANMVGRVLFPNASTSDGLGYRIASFTDTTHITLENNYSGGTIGSQSYLIGEVPDIPPAYHEALVDYGAYRYYRRRRDLNTAKDLKAAFDEALMLCEESYASKTSSQYVRTPRAYSGYRQFKRDLTIP
jgi:hypothetical protein